MGATVSVNGKDISGPTLASNPNMTGADAGEFYYDTTAGQLWLCVGSGTFPANFVAIGAAGNVAPGAAGSSKSVTKLLTPLTDATFATLCTLTIPNGIMGGGLHIVSSGTLGDGDSTQSAGFFVSISRISGAASGVTVGSAFGATTNNGVTANAALAIQAAAPVGANSATQTVAIQMKVTRSAGSSNNHVITATVQLVNQFGSGITVA